MRFDTIIRGAQVVMPEGVQRLDVAIGDGTIVALATDLHEPAGQTIDASGLHLFPGVIDAHVHFNEPGRTEWEGWATGSAALAAGGGTCCFEMPLNADPPTLDAIAFDLKHAAAAASSRVDFALWGGLTPDNLDKLDELADRGVVGLKAFMSDSGIDDFHHADEQTLRRGMSIAARRGMIVAVHAESESMTRRLTAKHRTGGRGWADYLASRPVEAEVEAIEHAISLAAETGCRLHIVHVSSGTAIEAAKRLTGSLSVDVTLETCPHYLLLSEADLVRQGASAKCAPPLRSQAEVERLRACLLRGDIDIVASDHSPAPATMKRGDDVFAIWGGIAGIQSTLPALLTLGIPAVQVAQRTAARVAERFGIARKGRIAVGNDADIAFVDLHATYTLARENLLDRHQLSPYVGRQFTGLVRRTMACGQTIFVDGSMVGSSCGRLVCPTPLRSRT